MNDSEKIRKLRELRGYKQESMAHQLGITPRAYSKIENGQTALSMDRLKQIAEVFEIDPIDILDFCEENIYRSCRKCAYHQLSNFCSQHQRQEEEHRKYIEKLESQLAELQSRVI